MEKGSCEIVKERDTQQTHGQTNYTPLLNQWTFIVMTLDGNDTLNFYVNGTLIYSQYYLS